MTDAEQCAAIIAIARKKRDLGEYATPDDVRLDDGEQVWQEQSGCWVRARVWVENVYIVDDGED